MLGDRPRCRAACDSPLFGIAGRPPRRSGRDGLARSLWSLCGTLTPSVKAACRRLDFSAPALFDYAGEGLLEFPRPHGLIGDVMAEFLQLCSTNGSTAVALASSPSCSRSAIQRRLAEGGGVGLRVAVGPRSAGDLACATWRRTLAASQVKPSLPKQATRRRRAGQVLAQALACVPPADYREARGQHPGDRAIADAEGRRWR